jgi:dTDP-4-amino-4,6-dideoxygalactose transaminase
VIPILDLTAQYRALKPEIDAAIARVLESGTFIMGPNVEAFEHEIAAYLGVKHAIGLNSGTDALHLALRALDIGPGDEVITTPFTFVATTEAIGIIGATPVFVDIDPVTYNIDAAQIESAITPRTRAILPVHLYGCPADMPAIMAIAERHGLAVVEDCAQAIGAMVNTQKVGSIGTVGCFSFFPSKNLGAFGDGGVATTNDDDIAARIRALRLHGGDRAYYHNELGVNSRLDEIQAAVLRVKLPHLERWIETRRAIAERYNAGFQGLDGLTPPREPSGCRHVYHQYTVRTRNRNAVRAQLEYEHIEARVYYPLPLHRQPVNERRTVAQGRMPHAETASQEVLSLPMYPELMAWQQQRVVSAVASALHRDLTA